MTPGASFADLLCSFLLCVSLSQIPGPARCTSRGGADLTSGCCRLVGGGRGLSGPGLGPRQEKSKELPSPKQARRGLRARTLSAFRQKCRAGPVHTGRSEAGLGLDEKTRSLSSMGREGLSQKWVCKTTLTHHGDSGLQIVCKKRTLKVSLS